MAAQAESAVMVEQMMDKAANMSAEEWGDFTGQVAFEVLMEVGTAGAAAALTAAKVADKTVDVAKVLNKLEDISDGTKLLPPPKQLGNVENWDGVIRSTDEIFDPSKYKMMDGEKLGDFGENVVEGMLRKEEFGDYNTFYRVQNKSGNGVDIIATNKKGDVYIAEVKSTRQDKKWNNGDTKDLPLSKPQREMGGKDYADDRLKKAANEEDGYTDGKSTEEAIKAQEAIEDAKSNGNKIEHKKIDVHVDKNNNLRDTPKAKDWKAKPPKKKGK